MAHRRRLTVCRGTSLLAALACAVALLAGCAGGVAPGVASSGTASAPATQTPSVGTVLPGTRWDLTSLQGQPPLAGTVVSLEFGPEWLTGFTGCNNYGGSVDGGEYIASDDGTLQIRRFTVTLIGCPEEIMAQEEAYLRALTSSTRYRIVAGGLELQNASGRTLLVFAPRGACPEPPADLAGGEWRLVSVDGRAPGAETVLVFLDEHWMVESSPCLAYLSDYERSGDSLSLFSSTLLGKVCSGWDQPAPSQLESASSYCLAQGRLQVRNAAGRQFAYEPLSPADRPALEGTAWSLLAIAGERAVAGLDRPMPDATMLVEGSEITLALGNGTATGSAGCNTYQATYTADGAALHLGSISATKRACPHPDGMMLQEQRYLEALAGVTGYRIAGQQLWLVLNDGRYLTFAIQPPR